MDYHVFSVWAWIKVKFWLFEPHLFLLFYYELKPLRFKFFILDAFCHGKGK